MYQKEKNIAQNASTNRNPDIDVSESKHSKSSMLMSILQSNIQICMVWMCTTKWGDKKEEEEKDLQEKRKKQKKRKTKYKKGKQNIKK